MKTSDKDGKIKINITKNSLVSKIKNVILNLSKN